MEAAVTAIIACFAAGSALTNRIHNRINYLDRKLDDLELKVATSYVQKEEFSAAVKKMEDHMIRIENKIDQIALRNS